MRILNTALDLPIPKSVKVTVSKRVVTVKGPMGELSRSFRTVPMDMSVVDHGKRFRVEIWFARKKQAAVAQTIISLVRNMITGVTKGYQLRLRFAYAHFPVNCKIEPNAEGKPVIEVRNFLGEKRTRSVVVPDGVKSTITDPGKTKDELVLEGIDLPKISQTAAALHQVCAVKRKDIRKFLDGIYVQKKGTIKE